MTKRKDDSSGLEVLESITVGGVKAQVVEDGLGHVWTIPAEAVEDMYDHVNIFEAIKHRFDERFHYQLEPRSNVGRKMLEGFVVVTKEELGLPGTLVMEYGQPVDTTFAVGDAVLMKIPKLLAERRLHKREERIREVRDLTEPSKYNAESRQSDGGQLEALKAEKLVSVEETLSRRVG